MPAVLDVDPDHYEAASASMGQDLAPGLAHAFDDLTRGLAGSGTMAGHDHGGRAWGEQYDLAAPQALAAIATVERAALKLATLLQRTGFNHAEAESTSTAQRQGGVPDGINYAGSAQITTTCGQVPVAAGGSGDYPAGWSLIRDGIGFEWPDGHQDRLRTAARAWSTAAKTIAGLEIFVDRAVAAINLQQSPEVADAVTVCGGMRTHLATVSSTCGALGTSCSDLASAIDKAHHEAIHEMKVLVSMSTCTQVLGAIGAVFSLGTSEVLAQGAEAVEIGVVRGKVIKILSALAIRARAIEVELSALKSKVAQVGRSLQPILDADVVTAETTAVPQMAGMTAAETRLAAAETRLVADAGATRVDLEAQDKLGGHTIDDHVAKSDQDLIGMGKKWSGTFPDLETAERLTADNIALNQMKIRAWLAADDRDVLPVVMKARPGDGRVYVRSTGKFVPAVTIRTILFRTADGGYRIHTSYPAVPK